MPSVVHRPALSSLTKPFHFCSLRKMSAFIIQQNDEIKEAFSYELPFNEMTQQSITQYAFANYGPDTTVRKMTDDEKTQFILQGDDCFRTKWQG